MHRPANADLARLAARLRLPLLVVLCAVGAAASPRAARADGLYVTESFGGSSFRDELAGWIDGAFRIKVAIGARIGDTSVEGWIGGDLPTDYHGTELFTYGLDLKRAFRLSPHAEVYVRGSMSRMEIEDGPLTGYGGRGLGVGTGAQLEGKAPIIGLLYPPVLLVCAVSDACARGKLGPRATVAVFFDQGYDFYRLHPGRGAGRGGLYGAIDAEATRWTIGFAVGSDF